MKINANNNVQSKHWSNEKSHINRTFEDRRLSERNWDSNLGIDWKLSNLNRSTDGKIISTDDPSHPYKFKFNKRKYRHIERIKKADILKLVKPYVKAYNNAKSVKNNPKRAIKDPMSLFSKNDERTTVDGLAGLNKSNLQTNYDNIKLIQRHYGRGYKNARMRYTKAISYALAKYEKEFNQRHTNVKKFHWTTNVDETTGETKPSNRPDALHGHSQIFGFCYTKYDKRGNPILHTYQTRDKHGRIHNHRMAKPSFNVDRALCHEYGIKYSYKNAGKALHKFHEEEDNQIIKTVQSVLINRFQKVPEFKHMYYTPTRSQKTGLSHKMIKRIFAYKQKMKKLVANQNRNTARKLQREQRRIEYIKSHRKRNRIRAKKTKANLIQARKSYADMTLSVNSLKSKTAYYKSKASSATSTASKAVNTVANMLSEYGSSSNANYQSLAMNGATVQGKHYTGNDLLTIEINKQAGLASSASAIASNGISQTASIISQVSPIQTKNKKIYSKSQYKKVAENGANVNFGKGYKYYTPLELINDGIDTRKADYNDWATSYYDKTVKSLNAYFASKSKSLNDYLNNNYDNINKHQLNQKANNASKSEMDKLSKSEKHERPQAPKEKKQAKRPNHNNGQSGTSWRDYKKQSIQADKYVHNEAKESIAKRPQRPTPQPPKHVKKTDKSKYPSKDTILKRMRKRNIEKNRSDDIEK